MKPQEAEPVDEDEEMADAELLSMRCVSAWGLPSQRPRGCGRGVGVGQAETPGLRRCAGNRIPSCSATRSHGGDGPGRAAAEQLGPHCEGGHVCLSL